MKKSHNHKVGRKQPSEQVEDERFKEVYSDPRFMRVP
jgi:hypothetical protein